MYMNVSELCATPSKARNNTNQTMESYSLTNTFREPDQDIASNSTPSTSSLPVTRFTLPPLSQRHSLQQRLPSLVDISSSFEESTEDSTEEVQATESIKSGEGLEVKQLIEKCSTLCNDLARYKTWRKGLEQDREAIFDFVTHTAHDILDSLVAMQQQQEAVVSNEAEYEMIRQARNWKENRKPKYRRRSKRNMIGQQCHSCHTSETPEWRRGPDGARTLCNACGLHYSKLLRKESVTVAYKFLANGPTNSNNDGSNKVDQQLQLHHQQEDQQQELNNRHNDEQHNHLTHYIQPPPPPPPPPPPIAASRPHQHQLQHQYPHQHPHSHQQQQQEYSHHHHHHHQQQQQISLTHHQQRHHHLHHHDPSRHHPSHQN